MIEALKDSYLVLVTVFLRELLPWEEQSLLIAV